MSQRIHYFSQTTHLLNDPANCKEVLGGKGWGLMQMAPKYAVPPGFVITTDVCKAYAAEKNPVARSIFMDDLMVEVNEYLGKLASDMGYMPLLSVRSGAPVSMPGMMDTILNVGLRDDAMPAWNGHIGEWATVDSYRRLIHMLGTTAYGIPSAVFEETLAAVRKEFGAKSESDLTVGQMAEVVIRYKKRFEDFVGKPFPQDLLEQVRESIKAVFASWDSERAVEYRKINKIDADMGTACVVQAMVFGNTGENSGTGVFFTRNPSTGEKALYGEFLVNAQGEDVVAGIRTPMDVWDMNTVELQGTVWPKVYKQLETWAERLEEDHADMVDAEFTVQDGKAYLLQSRVGKRAAQAAFRVAVDMVAEDKIGRSVALSRLTRAQYKTVSRPQVDPKFKTQSAGHGLPASPGVVSGKPVFSAVDAVNCTEPCVLVTAETSPDDIAGMNAAVGVLTFTGGMTSHAAVVARAMDKPCVVGASELHHKGWTTVKRVTLDGSTGRVWLDVDVPVVDASKRPEVETVTRWCVEESGFVMQAVVPQKDGRHCVMAAYWWGDHEMATAVVSALAKRETCAGITLDLTPPPVTDSRLEYCFTAPTVAKEMLGAHDAFAKFVENKLLAAMSTHVLVGLTVIGGSSKLAEIGFNVPRAPKNMSELIEMDNVVMSTDFVNKVIGGASAWAKVSAALDKAGIKIKVVPRATPAEYAVFTVLQP